MDVADCTRNGAALLGQRHGEVVPLAGPAQLHDGVGGGR
jgi:hypothetical protein